MPPSDRHHPQGSPRQLAGTVTPAAPAVQQRSTAALGIALLSLAGMLALSDLGRGVYLAAYALLAGVIALWLAITAITRARRARTARPRGCLTATVIAGVGITLSGIMLVAFAVLGKQLSAYNNCLAGASTIASQQACQSQFTHAVSKEISALQSGGGR